MALLLIQICVYTKNNVSGDGRLKNILLIDEAHVLLGGHSAAAQEGAADSQGSTIEALENMIAEIRSYGTGIIIADQSPTKVGRSIVANTNVKVIFKLVEKENRDAISTATNMDQAAYDLLGRLGVGEAMLHYGRVPVCRYGRASTEAVNADVPAVLQEYDAFLLANHGLAAVAATALDAAYKLEGIETIAKVLHLARERGGECPLGDADVAEIERLRLSAR